MTADVSYLVLMLCYVQLKAVNASMAEYSLL